jgi:hypothetical protein
MIADEKPTSEDYSVVGCWPIWREHGLASRCEAWWNIQFAAIRHCTFGHHRLLTRGLSGARAEVGIATMAHSHERIKNVLRAAALAEVLLQD